MPAPAPGPQPTAAVVLAFDTSTERLALGLQAPSGAHLVQVAGGAAASAALLPQAQALLAGAGLVWADVQAIAFGRGPGAFTGLRTACAVAQGLGLGLSVPLLPLDSLLIVAEDARAQALAGPAPAASEADRAERAPPAPFEVAVAMDARMDEVYAGRYRWHTGGWQVLQAPALMTLPALQQAWAEAPPQALAGSALVAFAQRLRWPAAPQWPQEHSRAGALLRLAVAAAARGEGVDAADALPLYLRDKVALTTDERAARQREPAGSA